MIIEIKEPGTEKKLAEVIKKNKISNQVVIASFYAASIYKIKNLFIPEKIKTGLIFAKTIPKPMPIALRVKSDFIIPLHILINEKMVEDAHKHGMKILAWTVDKRKIADRLSNLGVDAIASNNLLKNV